MQPKSALLLALASLCFLAPGFAQEKEGDSLEVPSEAQWQELAGSSERKPVQGPLDPESASAKQERFLTLYDVRDLVDELASPAQKSATPDAEPSSQSAEAARKAAHAQALQLLQGAVQNHIQPPLGAGGAALHATNEHVLVLNGTAAQHEWMQSFCLRLRRDGLSLVKVETRCVEIPRDALRSLGLDTPPMGAVQPEHEVAIAQVLANADRKEGWKLIARPEVLLHPLSQGSVAILDEFAYIKEWQVTMVQPKRTLIADPVIDVIQEGYTFEFTVTPVPENQYAVAMKFRRATVERPIETRKVRVATDPASESEISIPVVTRMTIESTFTAAKGKAIAFVTPANDSDRDLVVWLRVTSIGGAIDPWDVKVQAPDAESVPADRRR